MTNVFIKTFGCALNKADSETMAGLLENADFHLVDDIDRADLIIVNSCTVKTKTEKNFFKYLKRLPKKPTLIAGCIPQTDPEKLRGYSLLGTSQLNNIVQVAEETLNENPVEAIVKEDLERLSLPKIRKNPIVEILPISAGCLGDCAYCKTKAARGELKSYKPEDIITLARKAVTQGVKEIWLTSQDTGAYGKDIDTNLPNLLKKILEIPGMFMIRLGMTNPNHVKEFTDELIEIYKNRKMFKFLHLPVQSGSNDILKKMNRFYTTQDFKEIINKLRKEIPALTISTDIICGFPSETDMQFSETLQLIRETKPDVINISRFFPRPKTKAAKMKNQVHGSITKKRSKLMTDMYHNTAYMNNEKWYNWTGNIIIDEKGKNNTWIGRNFAYKPVIVEGELKIGDVVKVKIMKTTIFDLRGNVLK